MSSAKPSAESSAKASAERDVRSAKASAERPLVDLARSLVDIDSTTGSERDAGLWLAAHLRDRGWRVAEQPVDSSRFNVFASAGRPEVVFSTHYDCVPPFFPSRRNGDRLFGRGSCDAKGILAAQVSAAETLRARGESRVGLLFVVGEERGSDGARIANENAPEGCRYLINGEPTDNRLGAATRGILRVRLRAAGRAAHSAFPELGESAIDKLIDALVDLRAIELPVDALLGRTHYTIGLFNGGVAPNVIPPSAEAEIMFRTVGNAEQVRHAIAHLESRISIEHVLEVPPVRMATLEGIEQAVFAYTTDVPLLTNWGRPLLFGPGSIHVAHTAEESVSVRELEAAQAAYVHIVERLLAGELAA